MKRDGEIIRHRDGCLALRHRRDPKDGGRRWHTAEWMPDGWLATGSVDGTYEWVRLTPAQAAALGERLLEYAHARKAARP